MIEKIKALLIKYKEIISYLFFGVLTTVVSLGSYYLCVFTFLDGEDKVEVQIANVISWIAAVTFAYFTNRKYVFESSSQNKLLEAASFYGSRVTTLLMDMAAMHIMVIMLHIDNRIAKIIVQVIVTVANYVLSKFLVFRKKKENKEEE